VTFTLLVGLFSAPASSQFTSGINLSGAVVNALAQAYGSAGLGNDQDAPLNLVSYLVTITQWNDSDVSTRNASFQIVFGKEGANEYSSMFVGAGTGTMSSLQGPGFFGGGIALPGIIAGSIITAYRFALSDKRLPESSIKQLRTGAYNVEVEPGWSRSIVTFSALPNMPETVSILPAPSPTPSVRPGQFCLGACGNIFARYIISALDGKVAIRTQVVL
jgi:hypothetical protein